MNFLIDPERLKEIKAKCAGVVPQYREEYQKWYFYNETPGFGEAKHQLPYQVLCFLCEKKQMKTKGFMTTISFATKEEALEAVKLAVKEIVQKGICAWSEFLEENIEDFGVLGN